MFVPNVAYYSLCWAVSIKPSVAVTDLDKYTNRLYFTQKLYFYHEVGQLFLRTRHAYIVAVWVQQTAL